MDREKGNLLKAAQISKKNQMNVVCIQLAYVARTLWLAKQIRFQEFIEVFHIKFVHASAKQDMQNSWNYNKVIEI